MPRQEYLKCVACTSSIAWKENILKTVECRNYSISTLVENIDNVLIMLNDFRSLLENK